MVDQALKCARDPLSGSEAERAHALRECLPRQLASRRVEDAQLRYRTVSYRHVARELRQTLPRKLFARRFIQAWQINDYPRFLPDAVLLKWDEARASGLFETFWVLEPRYGRPDERARDPWLIGKISGHLSFTFGPEDRVSILAYWE